MKKIDLTNQRFGKLVVVCPAPKKKDKYTRWICQCDCGQITEVRTDFLRNGHTTSCGCIKQTHFGRHNLIGERFGKLTVLEHLPPDKKHCQCDCGNTVDVFTYNLTSGNTRSCGCLQKEQASKASFISLIGKQFGKLMVLERVENNRYGHTCYRCQCECGGITIVDSTNLRNGNTISCGCVKSKGEMIINKWLQEHNITFQTQYSHPQIVYTTGRRPFFDFAILFDNQLIALLEYNGKQHYEATGGWNTEEVFKITQNRDQQKRQQCKQLNIPLFEIAYFENIEEKLQEIINTIFNKEEKENA